MLKIVPDPPLGIPDPSSFLKDLSKLRPSGHHTLNCPFPCPDLRTIRVATHGQAVLKMALAKVQATMLILVPYELITGY